MSECQLSYAFREPRSLPGPTEISKLNLTLNPSSHILLTVTDKMVNY